MGRIVYHFRDMSPGSALALRVSIIFAVASWLIDAHVAASRAQSPQQADARPHERLLFVNPHQYLGGEGLGLPSLTTLFLLARQLAWLVVPYPLSYDWCVLLVWRALYARCRESWGWGLPEPGVQWARQQSSRECRMGYRWLWCVLVYVCFVFCEGGDHGRGAVGGLMPFSSLSRCQVVPLCRTCVIHGRPPVPANFGRRGSLSGPGSTLGDAG